MLLPILRRGALSLPLLLAGCAATNPLPAPDFTSYVVLGEYGAAVARVRQAGREGIVLLVRTPQGNRPVVLPLAAAE